MRLITFALPEKEMAEIERLARQSDIAPQDAVRMIVSGKLNEARALKKLRASSKPGNPQTALSPDEARLRRRLAAQAVFGILKDDPEVQDAVAYQNALRAEW